MLRCCDTVLVNRCDVRMKKLKHKQIMDEISWLTSMPLLVIICHICPDILLLSQKLHSPQRGYGVLHWHISKCFCGDFSLLCFMHIIYAYRGHFDQNVTPQRYVLQRHDCMLPRWRLAIPLGCSIFDVDDLYILSTSLRGNLWHRCNVILIKNATSLWRRLSTSFEYVTAAYTQRRCDVTCDDVVWSLVHTQPF